MGLSLGCMICLLDCKRRNKADDEADTHIPVFDVGSRVDVTPTAVSRRTGPACIVVVGGWGTRPGAAQVLCAVGKVLAACPQPSNGAIAGPAGLSPSPNHSHARGAFGRGTCVYWGPFH